jgi:hypothetical protein
MRLVDLEVRQGPNRVNWVFSSFLYTSHVPLGLGAPVLVTLNLCNHEYGRIQLFEQCNLPQSRQTRRFLSEFLVPTNWCQPDALTAVSFDGGYLTMAAEVVNVRSEDTVLVDEKVKLEYACRGVRED